MTGVQTSTPRGVPAVPRLGALLPARRRADPRCAPCGDTTFLDGEPCPHCEAAVNPTFPCGCRVQSDSPAPTRHCCRCRDQRVLISGWRDAPAPPYPHGSRIQILEPCPDCRTLTPAARLQRFFEVSLIPPRVREWTLVRWAETAGADAWAVPILDRWVERAGDPDVPPFLVLAGDVGSGKTALAAAAVQALHVRRGIAVRFYTTSGLLESYRATFNGTQGETAQLDTELRTIGCLVLDDLAAEQDTDWARARLTELVDARYRENALTVITTNAGYDGLPGRIASRISDGRAAVLLDLTSADRRTGARVTAGDGMPGWAS